MVMENTTPKMEVYSKVSVMFYGQFGAKTMSHIKKWSDDPELFAQVKKWWADNCSASYIAKEVNKRGYYVSRSAVLGKLNRMGIKKKDYRPKKKKEKLVPIRKHVMVNQHAFREHINPEVLQPVDVQPTPEDLAKFHVSLIDATPFQCRWVIGEPVDLLYCGAPVAENNHWQFCEHHLKRAVSSNSTSSPKKDWEKSWKTRLNATLCQQR